MWTHTEHRSELNLKQDDRMASRRFTIERKPDSSYFYELEEAVVLDIILDESHPEFSSSELNPSDWPPNIDGSKPVAGDKNYGVLGKVKFRFLNSERGKSKEELNWATPIENTGVSEFPLMNEIVIIAKYLNKYYYSKKLNFKSVVNSNASFITERVAGYVESNLNEYTGKKNSGPTSKMNFDGGANYEGVLGNYFKFNPNIRALKRYEGDTILESRFGSSIRIGAYDGTRKNDAGLGEYSEGGGNPMVLIRNRQSPIKGTPGFTAKGYTAEDINSDGSSMHFTSGKTISTFNPTTNTPFISGILGFKIPKLDGDQIVINSDRLIFSSKVNETLFFSKKSMCMASDEEFIVTCKKKMTLTSVKTATINAPKIYLGDHGKPYEPALLGRTTVAWMEKMVDWMLLNVNTQIQTLTTLIAFAELHVHLGNLAKPTSPPIPLVTAVQIALWVEQLASLKASQISLLAHQLQLSSLMSGRVFVSGGVD